MKRSVASLLLAAVLAAPAPAHAQAVEPEPSPAAAPESPAPARSLAELLERVRAARSDNGETEAARERVFSEERERQLERLARTRAELQEAMRRASALEQRFDATQRELATREAELQQRLGALGAVFAELGRQGPALREHLRRSDTRAWLGDGDLQGLEALLAPGSGAERLPAIGEFESLWFRLQRELAESGGSRRFEALVLLPDGSSQRGEVVRAGPFAALSADGAYLDWQPGQGAYARLLPQPETLLDDSAAFVAAREGLSALGFDPSPVAGQPALRALAASPDLVARLGQVGLAGHLAIMLGLAGMALAAWRLVDLESLAKACAPGTDPPDIHPVALMRATAATHAGLDAHAMEHLLHELLLRELPRLERGLGILRALAGAAPVLGVLGTVVGLMQAAAVPGSASDVQAKLAAALPGSLAAAVMGLAAGVVLLVLQGLLAARSREVAHRLDHEAAVLVADRARATPR
ncbi:MAG: MotA/TolQ/ExbB proton channel family protein [Gammaproteobacteria bacterium]